MDLPTDSRGANRSKQIHEQVIGNEQPIHTYINKHGVRAMHQTHGECLPLGKHDPLSMSHSLESLPDFRASECEGVGGG